MTPNEEKEVLELAKKCGADTVDYADLVSLGKGSIVFAPHELLAFASALRSQDQARVAMLVDASRQQDYVDDYEFRGDYDYQPSETERMLIMDALIGYLDETLGDTQQSAKTFLAAKVLEDAQPLRALLAKHSALLEANPYCYFELAYTRRTEWMAWLCSKPQEDDPQRVVLAKGQGATPDEAAQDAIESMSRKSAEHENGKTL